MKCPKCGIEFDGDICPICNTKMSGDLKEVLPEESMNDGIVTTQMGNTPSEENETIPNEEKTTDNEIKKPSPDIRSEETSYHLQEDPIPKKEPNGKIRLGLEIAGIVILLITLVSSAGKIPKEKYDTLNDKYKKVSEELEQTNSSLEDISATYAQYKNKMSKFDNLSDEQIDTLIAEVDKIAAEKKAAEEKAAAEEAAKQKAAASATIEQKNALSKAKDYLSFTSFSHSGLIQQLEYEGFSTEASTYAADNCGADWNQQAAAKAKDYMDLSSFSRESLIDQLEYEGFSPEQAAFGASAVGY